MDILQKQLPIIGAQIQDFDAVAPILSTAVQELYSSTFGRNCYGCDDANIGKITLEPNSYNNSFKRPEGYRTLFIAYEPSEKAVNYGLRRFDWLSAKREPGEKDIIGEVDFRQGLYSTGWKKIGSGMNYASLSEIYGLPMFLMANTDQIFRDVLGLKRTEEGFKFGSIIQH